MMSPVGLAAANAAGGIVLAARGHPFASAIVIAATAEGVGMLLGRMYPQRFPLLAGETTGEYFRNVAIVMASWWVTKQATAPYQLPRAAR